MEGVMPKARFWKSTAVEGDDPDLTVTWGDKQPEVQINGTAFDRSGLNRLIRALRRARDQTFGSDA